MTEVTRVYWKLKEGAESSYISGWCSPQDVEDYGYVDETPLPTEITVTLREDGSMLAISPPVIGRRNAYRYQVSMSAGQRADIGSLADYMIDGMLQTMETSAPEKGATRENWWWYCQDNFRYLGYRKKTPISLMKKWKRGMLEIMLEGHPEKKAMLLEWDSCLTAHNSHNKRNRTSTTSAHRKKHGDLVVLPFAINFDSGTWKQIFRYDVEERNYQARAKHSLRIDGVRYRISHGEAMTFADGAAPDKSLSVPIRAAMCLLAWSETPQKSAHTILAARQKFEPLAQSTLAELEAYLALPLEDSYEAAMAAGRIDAAVGALMNFRRRENWEDESPSVMAAQERLESYFARTLSLLRNARAEIATDEE